jgi:methanogenic corrinoid protein MtbC1
MENEILINLKKAVLEYDKKMTKALADKAICENINPMTVMDVLTDAIRQVGDGFGKGELFLPELVGAAEALQEATPVIEKAIKRDGKRRKSLGTVALGTVFGDLHTIGKSMVGALLTAEGFEVHDLGINVPTEKFVSAVKDFKVNILAMSALLTTTAPEAKFVIEALKDEGIRDKVKVMLGGGAITADFANSIGVDGYDPTAPGAVRVAKELLGL